jgi:hypothetical protein
MRDLVKVMVGGAQSVVLSGIAKSEMSSQVQAGIFEIYIPIHSFACKSNFHKRHAQDDSLRHPRPYEDNKVSH